MRFQLLLGFPKLVSQSGMAGKLHEALLHIWYEIDAINDVCEYAIFFEI